MMNEALNATIRALEQEIIALRHELHRHPEIRFEEQWTSDRVARFLDEAGIVYTRGYARGTGIVAVVKGQGTKTVALRADMDALELEERTGAPYASTIPGRMHACGHDGHTACLCGAAKALAMHADQLKGSVKFIFQPGEEIAGAGRLIVEEGVLDDVHAAFALHVWPALPAGRIGVKSGPLMAGADWFRIEIQGRGCHGAHPDAGVDPVVVAAHITTALQTIVSREISPVEPAVVTVARIQAGVADNIIPETARLEGTFRALTEDVRKTIQAAIERIAEGTARAFRATAAVNFSGDAYAPLINDPAMTDFARKVIADTLGPDAVVEVQHPSMGAEDFA